MKSIQAAALILVAITTAGCGTRDVFRNSINGEPIVDDTVWLPRDASMPNDSGYLPPACSPPSSSQQTPDPYSSWVDQDGKNSTGQASIESCTQAMMVLIRLRSAHYMDSVLAANSTWNTFSDIAVVGMGAAGSLAGSSTSQILNAASSALTGTQGKINSDVLYSHSIMMILEQMKSDQTAQGIVIETKLQNHSYKSMYDAALDLYDYARASSWTEAMVSLEATAGATAKQCANQKTKNKIKSSAAKNAPVTLSTTNSEQDSSATLCPATQPVSAPAVSLSDKSTVEKIQTTLNNDKDASPILTLDGIFGSKTLKALNAFQTMNKLTLTVKGAATLDAATATALGL